MRRETLALAAGLLLAGTASAYEPRIIVERVYRNPGSSYATAVVTVRNDTQAWWGVAVTCNFLMNRQVVGVEEKRVGDMQPRSRRTVEVNAYLPNVAFTKAECGLLLEALQ